MKKRTASRKSKGHTRKVKTPIAGKPSVHVRYRPRKHKTFDHGKGPAPKRVQALVSKARGYKKRSTWTGAKTKAYNKKLAAEMRAANYPPNAVEKAVKEFSFREKRSIMGHAKAWSHVSKKYYKKVKGDWVVVGVKYKGKRRTMAQFKGYIKLQKYWEGVRNYRERYGLTLKEARELYHALRDEKWGQKVYQALY